MYALVRFIDDIGNDTRRYVVPVEDIDDFDPQHEVDFDAKTIYMVHWTDAIDSDNTGNYRAQILRLGATEQEARETSKRIPIPKLMVDDDYYEEDESASRKVTQDRKDGALPAGLILRSSAEKDSSSGRCRFIVTRHHYTARIHSAMTQLSPHKKLTDGLPRTAWEAIFEYLDGASRLALLEADRELKGRAWFERVTQSVVFTLNTDECTLIDYSQEFNMKELLQLRFNNCLALPSDVLLVFLSKCENIRELCVVNCVIEPPALVRMLAKKLTKVCKLGWSLYEDRRYESWLEKDAIMDTRSGRQLLTLKLQSMYVEVAATPQTADFLEEVLNISHDLQSLHIHAIRKDAVGVRLVDAITKLKAPRPRLRSFQYTCERVPPPTGRLLPEASNHFVRLEDVREKRTSLQGVCRAVVTLDADLEAACHFLEASKQPEHWVDVRSIAVVMLPPPQVKLERPLRVANDFLKPMRTFLQLCLANVSELSLTKSHFSVGCNFCFHDSLQCLANGCPFLEELYVTNDEALPCAACKVPLMFTERDFECMHRQTRLWRLSIADTARILSLKFLLGCRVTDIRFSLDSLVSDAGSVFYFGPRNILSANPRLSAMTIRARQGTILQNPCFATRLAAAKNLRILCLLTGAQAADSAVVNFMKRMVEELPLLQVVHIHYLAASSALKTVSWVNQRYGVVNTLQNEKKCRLQGKLLEDSVCLGPFCCATTYIGMARPRNRY
ncbi:hypothetical protein MTO96_012716 [Rhipicephalus appendiculatus]